MMHAPLLHRTEINVPGVVITLRWNVTAASALHRGASGAGDGGKHRFPPVRGQAAVNITKEVLLVISEIVILAIRGAPLLRTAGLDPLV